MLLPLLSFIASQHFEVKFIWHSMPMACFATEAAITIEFEFIVVVVVVALFAVVLVVWATLSAIDSACIVCCIARLSAPANSDRLLSFQFMLCPCVICVCLYSVHLDCLSAHMFTSCTTSFLFLFYLCCLSLSLCLSFHHFSKNTFTFCCFDFIAAFALQ